MSDSDYHPELKKLRSYWQFANVCQFFLLFGSAYGMDEFHTDTFEAELIRQDKEVIGRYMVKLCSNLSSGRGARMDTWENILKKELLKNNDELPINKEIESGFFDLTLFQQIVCIQFLCDLQFRDAFEKLREAAGGKDAYEELRVEPIGEDKKGNVYYLFDDNRLYVQTLAAPPPKKSNTKAIRKLSERKRLALEQGDSIDDTWSPVCITLSDWEEFPKQFETSRSVIEKELYKYLMEDVIPQVSSELKAKLKVIKKKETLATMVPKRSSRLQEKEKQKKELEDKLKQEKMIKAIDKDVNLDIVKHHPSINTREVRAKRRALRGLGDVEGIKDLKKQLIKDSFNKDNHSYKMSENEDIDILGDSGEFEFNCICGQHGHNFDDGTEQICCDQCNVWQHLNCQQLINCDGNKIQSLNEMAFFCHQCKQSGNIKKEANVNSNNGNHSNVKKDDSLALSNEEQINVNDENNLNEKRIKIKEENSFSLLNENKVKQENDLTMSSEKQKRNLNTDDKSNGHSTNNEFQVNSSDQKSLEDEEKESQVKSVTTENIELGKKESIVLANENNKLKESQQDRNESYLDGRKYQKLLLKESRSFKGIKRENEDEPINQVSLKKQEM